MTPDEPQIVEPLERIAVDSDAPLSLEAATPDEYDPDLDGDDSSLKEAMP